MPWPISDAACPVSEPASASVAGTSPKYAGKPRSWSTPSPSEAAACGQLGLLDGLPLADEGGVARVRDRRAQRDPADPAGRVVAVVLEPLAVHDHGGGAVHRARRLEPGPQQREAADHLERRAGCVAADRRGGQPAAAGAAGDREQRRRSRAGSRPGRWPGLTPASTRSARFWSPEVERRRERVAGLGRDAEHLPGLALGVDGLDLRPGGAAQPLVVPRLEAAEPGLVAGPVDARRTP